jgi:hypothetical protein
MPGRPDPGERLAALEAHVQDLKERLGGVDASLQQTVSEFRRALDKHRDHHRDEAREASNSRWKLATLAVALLGVASSIGLFFIGKLLF